VNRFLRAVCLLLVFSFVFALPVSAEDTVSPMASGGDTVAPMANAYIAAHTLSITKTGNYQFEVWFDVIANGEIMDEIGVSEIIIYRSPDGESWYDVAVYTPDDHPEMMAENASHHNASITYSNATGKYYKAYVTFHAKKGNGTGEILRYTSELQMR